MATTLYSFQEEGHRFDSGDTAVVTLHPEVRISIRRTFDDFTDTVRVAMFINVGGKTIGIAENEYPDIETLMDDLGIDEIDEVWEVLDK